MSSCRLLRHIAVLSAALLLSACRSQTSYTPDTDRQNRTANSLDLAGPWSAPIDGLRCRILLDTDQTTETTFITGVFVIENASDRDILLTSTASPPFATAAIAWAVDAHPLPSDPSIPPAAHSTTANLKLPPRQRYVSEPAAILIPPGPGARLISASFRTDHATLTAEPILIRVAPADWGPPDNGIRLRLASRSRDYFVGDNLPLFAFIHNIDHDPLVLHPPDWSTLQIDLRRDLILLIAKSADPQYATVQRNAAWWAPIPNSLLLAPGKYNLRLEIQSPELPVTHQRAWHGTLISNDLTIDVIAR